MGLDVLTDLTEGGLRGVSSVREGEAPLTGRKGGAPAPAREEGAPVREAGTLVREDGAPVRDGIRTGRGGAANAGDQLGLGVAVLMVLPSKKPKFGGGRYGSCTGYVIVERPLYLPELGERDGARGVAKSRPDDELLALESGRDGDISLDGGALPACLFLLNNESVYVNSYKPETYLSVALL